MDEEESFWRLKYDGEGWVNEEVEELLCSWCNGSGEGFIDGSACVKCHGLGTEKIDDDDTGI